MAEWPTSSVTSAEIVDGSIVDADVAAGAAIQVSKLSGVETPAGAQSKADDAQAGAEATAAAALSAHNALTSTAHGLPDTSTLIVEGDARLTDTRTPTDGSVTAGKLAADQRLGVEGLDVTDASAAANSVAIAPTAAKGTSTSTGGAFLLTMTGAIGAGAVIYSNRGADAGGRLLVVRADNPAFNQQSVFVQHKGTNHAVVIDHHGTGLASLGLSVTSDNPDDTTGGFTGSPLARAVLKIRNVYTSGSNGNSSGLNVTLEGTGTQAQGIYVDCLNGGTTGKLLNIRNNSVEMLVLQPNGALEVAGAITSGGTAVVLTTDSRLSDARTPTAHKSSHAVGGSDALSALDIAALGLADTRASVLGRRWDFDTDPFGTDLGEWGVVTGTAPTVSGGVASQSTATETVMLTANTWTPDVEVRSRQNVTAVGTIWRFTMKASDGSNFIQAIAKWESATEVQSQIWKNVGGTYTLLASAAKTGLTLGAGGPLWIVARAVGNVIVCESWLTDPALGGSPTASATATLTGGNATQFGAGVRGKAGTRTNSTGGATLEDLTIRPLTGRVRRRQVDVISGTSTWAKPANVKLDPTATVEALVFGAWGGGGSGARAAAGVACSGGASGGQGGVSREKWLASDIPDSVTTVIGAGGTGGAAQTTNSSNGNSGAPGGNTYFAMGDGSTWGLGANPGGGGEGGKLGAASTAGYGNHGYTFGAYSPGTDGRNGNNGAAGSSAYSGWLPTAASGGGIDAANVAYAGGGSQYAAYPSNSTTGGGGAATGAAGSDGKDAKIMNGVTYKTGGCGGGANASGAGGAGGYPSAGGGSARDGANSGAGADGIAGLVIVISEWTEAG